jgi:hypothetical protein
MAERGIFPDTQSERLSFRNYNSERDIVGLVVPEEMPESQRDIWQQTIIAAWGGGISVEILFLRQVVHDPKTARQTQTCAALFMIDPALDVAAPVSPDAIHAFVLLGINREINGTVGEAPWSGIPTFVVGDLSDPHSGVAALETLTANLYVHGRIKNPAGHISTAPADLAGTVRDFQRHSLVRPAVVQCGG